MSQTNIVTPSGFDTSSFGNVVELSSPSAISVQIVEKGLHVASIKFKDSKGFEHDIIPGSDDPAEYVDERKFRHCLIGRYCNRLPSEVPLPIPNSATTITLPSYPLPGQNLHGGPSPAGWDEKVLTVLKEDELTMWSAKEKKVLEAARGKGQAEVWGLIGRDGEGGHVGTVKAEVAFLSLPPRSTKSKSTEKGSAIGRVDADNIGVYDHNLSLLTKNILNLDPVTSLPTGTLLPLSTLSAAAKNFGGPGGKTIGHKGDGYPTALTGETKESKMGQGYPGEGYDDFWVFDREGKRMVVKDGELEGLDVFEEMEVDPQPVATLSSPTSSLTLTFHTNQSGMQAWSGTGGYDGSDARKKAHGGDSKRGTGSGYKGAAGLAMEFHAVYCAWMHPELQKIGWDTILNKGEVYNNWVEMTVSSE